MSKPVMLSWDEMMAKGQITVYRTPGNITKDIECPKCGGWYVCTEDFREHNCIPKNRSKRKLTPSDLDRLPWKTFRKGNGEWIFSNVAPYLLEAINNGHASFGNYHYWTYEGNRGTIFIARRKTS